MEHIARFREQRRHGGMSCSARCLRLIVARFSTERDRETVPPVDGDNRKCQIDKRLLIEMSTHLLVELIGSVLRRDLGDGLGPSERSPLAVRVKRCLAPRRKDK